MIIRRVFYRRVETNIEIKCIKSKRFSNGTNIIQLFYFSKTTPFNTQIIYPSLLLLIKEGTGWGLKTENIFEKRPLKET